MRKRIMLVATGAVLAAIGWLLMTYTSYSPIYAFVGGGLCVFIALIYDGKETPAAKYSPTNAKREIAEDITRGLS